MRVAALQYDTLWEDPLADFERLVPWIDTAAQANSELLVLPEMYACGFSMNTGVVAEPVDGPSTEFLRRQARRTGMWICGSLPELAEGEDRPHNTLVLAAPDGELSRYHKIHPFSAAGEDQHYQAGEALMTLEIAGVRVTFSSATTFASPTFSGRRRLAPTATWWLPTGPSSADTTGRPFSVRVPSRTKPTW